PTYGDRLATEVLPDDVSELVNDAARRLVALGVLRDSPHMLRPTPTPLERATEAAGDLLGFARPTLFTRLADHLVANHEQRLQERTRALNWELFDTAVGAATWTALEELQALGKDRKLVARDPAAGELAALRATLETPFAEKLLLWKKTKNDL